MRRIFTSRRLENAEGVARMLEAEGIETRVLNGRSYKGTHRHAFSYRDHAAHEPSPEVWIVKTEDLPRARALLREAGMLESSRPGQAPAAFAPTPAQVAPKSPEQRAMRLRIVMLFICVIAIAAMWLWR